MFKKHKKLFEPCFFNHLRQFWDFLIYIINFMARFILVSVLFSSLGITESIFEVGNILLLSVAVISFTTLFITRQLR